jgi:Fur family ferric uptake transcriptional regulator
MPTGSSRSGNTSRGRPAEPLPTTDGPCAAESAGLDLTRAVSHLRSRGLRLTRLKQAVLEQFADGSCAFSADDLAERMGLAGDLSPLYRCLSSLEETGVLTHFYLDDGSRRYDPADAFGRHHHHLVCVSCAGIERLETCGLERDLAARASASGFELRDHSLTLRGVCPICRAKERTP